MRRAILVIALSSVGAAVIVAGALATTNPGSATAATVVPTVEQDGALFYTDSQIDAAWQQATSDIAQALPAGASFPKTAPSFFHPNDGKNHLFESGLPAEIAARYWRCAWLNVSINQKANPSPDAAIVDAATNELTKYGSLPGVAQTVDVAQYESQMAAYAKSKGLDPQVAEFQLDCGVYSGEGTN